MAFLEGQYDEFVHGTFPFNLLDEESFEQLKPGMVEFNYHAGSRLYSFDERAEYFYLIISGKVELYREEDDKPAERVKLGPGCCFGEEALRAEGYRLTDARCLEKSCIVSLNRETALELANSHPKMRKAFALLYRTLKYRTRLHLPWLGKTEVVRLISRRHHFFFLLRIILPAVFSLGLSGWLFSVNFTSRGFSIWLIILALLILLAGLVIASWSALEWSNDYFFITTERVLLQKKLIGFFESRQEFPLSTILSSGVETFLIGRLFGYGAITLHSYNGNLRFKRLPAPDLILGLLEFERLRVAEEIKASDEQRMRMLLERRFGDDYSPEIAKWNSKSTMPAMTMYTSGSVLDALARFFGLRQVKKGAVVYRTHWWILLRKTFLPAVLLAMDVIFVLLKLTGGISWMSDSLAYIFAIILTVGAFGWWLYQYVDWHNDTYTITPD